MEIKVVISIYSTKHNSFRKESIAVEKIPASPQQSTWSENQAFSATARLKASLSRRRQQPPPACRLLYAPPTPTRILSTPAYPSTTPPLLTAPPRQLTARRSFWTTTTGATKRRRRVSSQTWTILRQVHRRPLTVSWSSVQHQSCVRCRSSCYPEAAQRQQLLILLDEHAAVCLRERGSCWQLRWVAAAVVVAAGQHPSRQPQLARRVMESYKVWRLILHTVKVPNLEHAT